MYCLTSSFSPPARWGLLDFIRAVLLLRLLRLLCLLRLLTRRLLLAVQIPVGTAGPPPRAPDPSGHCRTSTASCRSQWALPDLNRDFQVAVGTAGPQPRLPDRSGHCRTSTATSRSQWTLPDLNGKNVRKDVAMDQYLYIPFLGGWTSIYQLFWCSPGVQGFDTLPCPKICQTECQKICQKECQKIC